MAEIGFSGDAIEEMEEILHSLMLLDQEKVLKAGVRKAANRMKKAYKDILPTSGSSSDTGVTPLAASIKVKVFSTRNGVGARVGEDQNGKGYHAHLIEAPHRIVSHGKDTGKVTTGEPYGERARDKVQDAMDQDLIDGVRKAALKAVS